jgi:hypothetical protein
VSHSSNQTDVFRVPVESWASTKTFFAGLAVVGIALSAVGFFVDRAQFFHSYLTAFVFVLTIALGCLFFVMLQHVTRAGWSVAVRRMAEVSASTVPFFVILFIPVLFGLGELFHWTHSGAVEHDALLQHKSGYLNVIFFLIRAAFYFLVWALLARYFLGRSLAQDTTKDPMITVQMQRRAAPGIILFAFTLSFMAFDWLMSMDPHWYSTIFGVYTFAGTATASFAFLAIASMSLRRGGCLVNTVRVDHYQDLGRLMFAFSVFWAYISFSQFFLIWYGNIPEETIFYVHRIEGSWKTLSYFLAIGHFAVPFVLLMSRWTKRKPSFVTAMATWMLVIHYLDIYWLVMPNFHHEGVQFHWLDLACLAGVLGVFLTVFTRKLVGHALVPVGDPRLPECLSVEHLY